MTDHIANRDFMLTRLRQELVGPAAQGEPIDCTVPIPSFETVQLSNQPRCQASNGEEILQRDPPTARYGVGVLFPAGTRTEPEQDSQDTLISEGPPEEQVNEPDILTDEAARDTEEAQKRVDHGRGQDDTSDFDLSMANAFQASSIGVTFLAELPQEAYLEVKASGGRYTRLPITAAGKTRNWFLRTPISLQAEIPVRDLLGDRPRKVPRLQVTTQNLDGLDLRVEVFTRPDQDARRSLITVCLVNRGRRGEGSLDELCLFQSRFVATIRAPHRTASILPYPSTSLAEMDGEEESLALLYRKVQMFAVGHGCAADWDADEGATHAVSVIAECLPTYEAPSITPDLRQQDGFPVEISMAQLAGQYDSAGGTAALADMIRLYEDWIVAREAERAGLPSQFQRAAERHIGECRRCLERMKAGLEYLKSDTTALRAFQLANHAVLLQQLAGRREPRRADPALPGDRVRFLEPYVRPSPDREREDVGRWRAFQIAFLLMTIRSAGDETAADREAVELIWFPTGGGKTEAYLGLTAFSLFMRRLKNKDDAGVHVLMRYTLRLLTAQQFQRASGLICAMEVLRRTAISELGTTPFSIGIWLGSETTPNDRAEARSVLKGLAKGERKVENKFLVRQCPWCGAQMGPLEVKRKRAKGDDYEVLGYARRGDTVVFHCEELQCDFASELPIFVIDEDIYEHRPSLVIGTVDKFAMLAWKPIARSLFGIDADGQREASPPGLIIQDELHLISGPLGSMVGLYEPVIEDLCTDRRESGEIHPKIVSSTATIRRYHAQIKALYARDDVVLFPPPGLDASDSFFARYAREADGSLERGRMYVGINAPGLGSQQTAVVRTFASLLQAAKQLPPPESDPWWTLLVFFNTLRALGTSLSLFQSDIPDYLKAIRNRMGLDAKEVRRLWHILELTGRIRNEDVPKAIADLEIPSTSQTVQAVDVCLASNIIEVGIDIDRLSLMAVVSQPKSTAQYIQVTGRVGRKWWERPGLVATVYGASRPRDRSHFEKFRSYHERLYAQVEPTSLTPFSSPALDRALHAAMVAYVRQHSPLGIKPMPYPQEMVSKFAALIRHRVALVDSEEADTLDAVLTERCAEWQRWKRTEWTVGPQDPNPPLLRVPGDFVRPDWKNVSWATPQSMRTVDAECEAQITLLYLNDPDAVDA